MELLDLTLWQARFREALLVRNCAPGTVIGYVGELKPFFAFLRQRGLVSWAGLTREHLREYQTQLFYAPSRRGKPRALAPATRQWRMTAVARFVRWLVAQGWLLSDPTVGLESIQVTERLPRLLLTEAEVLAVLEAPDLSLPLGVRDRAMLELFYATGIRNGELGGLRLDQVDRLHGQLRIVGKGRKPRVLPLAPTAQHWLERYLHEVRPALLRDAAETRVFLTRYGRPLVRTYLAEMVARAARRGGLTQHVTPHVLRHSLATHLLRRGAGLRPLQALLGHASLETTQRYTRVEVSDLRSVLEAFHPRERPR